MTFEWMDDHCEDGGERPTEYCERLLFPLLRSSVRVSVRSLSKVTLRPPTAHYSRVFRSDNLSIISISFSVYSSPAVVVPPAVPLVVPAPPVIPPAVVAALRRVLTRTTARARTRTMYTTYRDVCVYAYLNTRGRQKTILPFTIRRNERRSWAGESGTGEKKKSTAASRRTMEIRISREICSWVRRRRRGGETVAENIIIIGLVFVTCARAHINNTQRYVCVYHTGGLVKMHSLGKNDHAANTGDSILQYTRITSYERQKRRKSGRELLPSG